jgi:hypothetical protein
MNKFIMSKFLKYSYEYVQKLQDSVPYQCGADPNNIKGTGSRGRFQKVWQKRIDLCLSKGCSGFLKYFKGSSDVV